MTHDPGSGGAGPGFPVFRFDGRRLTASTRHAVAEFPLRGRRGVPDAGVSGRGRGGRIAGRAAERTISRCRGPRIDGGPRSEGGDVAGTGGIHSAVAGDGSGILLAAEDIGRHNTVDRIAGETLLKAIDLSGKILVSSRRISSEVAAKGALLGVAVIAFRTSPTDMAIRIAREAGIALIGYVRGRRFTVYSHPWRIASPLEGENPTEGVTGVIVVGGPGSPDPEERSFRNLNTPEEYARLSVEEGGTGSPPGLREGTGDGFHAMGQNREG